MIAHSLSFDIIWQQMTLNSTAMNQWISLEEAAAYLNLGKTTLYGLTRDGKVPSKKIGKKWVFSRQDLDAWVNASRPIESFFMDVGVSIDENPQLREPQIEAYMRAYDFFSAGGKEAIIQLPVGCGKSGLASLIPFGISKGRVLIISPNLTIKEGLLETLDITNRQKCFWRKRGVLASKDMLGGPYVCTLDSGNLSVCNDSHIVLTNVHQLATNADKWLKKFDPGFFDLIIVDEAHHAPASSWQQVFDWFTDAKILKLTATPFRSDGKSIGGDKIYRYPFRKATINGYIKRVKASYVAPSELTFTAKGETKVYTLTDVLKMKTKDWFSKGIALSEVCNQNIVDNSLEKLEELRETGTHHQLIAVGCSVDHARAIRSLYVERGYKAEVIYAQLDEAKKKAIKLALKSGELDCIVQVQMLGEGFDHPKLSVAAIFRPYRSLAPYIQFVGRILRVIVQNDPLHPDNFGHVVTHVGMNLDQRLVEFKLFEKDDQRFWDEVVGGQDPEPSRSDVGGQRRLRVSEQAMANHEIADSLIEEAFVTADEEDLIRELETRMELLGLDSSKARTLVLEQGVQPNVTSKAAEPFQVQPQKQWEESRKRLNEKSKTCANILMNRLGLKRGGRKLINVGVPAGNDSIACLVLINQEVSKRDSRKRGEWSTSDFKTMMQQLDEVVNQLTRQFIKILENEK
jgi:DNA repair protein RadD